MQAEIKKLLHHREPYLMVSEIISDKEDFIETVKTPQANEGYVLGHFPGAPVVPGAMLQEICTQSAGILITKYHSPVPNYDSEKTKGWALGVLNKIEFAKFLSIVKPTSSISAKVKLIAKQDNLFKFRAKVYQDEQLKAKINFNLVNISDEVIR
jgi:3-hydroxyacyl-[acyl-carrier-protein] dehydratase